MYRSKSHALFEKKTGRVPDFEVNIKTDPEINQNLIDMKCEIQAYKIS